MNIKQLLFRGSVGLATVGLIVGGAAAFSAFEAHVVNVTATIENALNVPVEQNGLTFGEMFPEEVSHQTLPISLSESFMSTDRVDDVEYMIRQKPKCGIAVPDTDPVQYSGFTQVTENSDGTFVCPAGSVQLPLLCPYLSKTELDSTGAPTDNGIPSFHGLPGPWTEQTTEATQVVGLLSKQSGATSTNWDIDLHTPCFKGECSQDWASFVQTTNPAVTDPTVYEADPANEHQMFGCDLWVEVTGISLPTNTPATLTVIKHVDNTAGGDSLPSDFTMHVTGTNVSSASFPGADSPGTTVSLDPGSYSVSEDPVTGYSGSMSGDCSGTITSGQHLTCSVTNTFVVATGTLTVTKVVVNTGGGTKLVSDFPLFVDGSSVTSGVSTTTTAEAHIVTETSDPAYSSSFSGDCDSGGHVTVPASGSANCTLTNTFIFTTTLTVNKVVVPDSDPGLFNLQIDGSTAGSGANVGNGGSTGAVAVSTGDHSVGETAGTGTNLADYTASFSGDCDDGGNVSLNAGDHKACTITNTRNTGTITVNKVVSDPGDVSTQVAGDFQMTVDGNPVNQGQAVTVNTGSHTVGEVDSKDDMVSFSSSCTGGSVTVNNGDAIVCTVTNTVPFFTLTVTKTVQNDDGGTAVVSDFNFFVGPKQVISGTPTNFALGTYTVTESGVAGYQAKFGGDCDPITQKVTGTNGQNLTCTIINDDIPPIITLINQPIGGTNVSTDFVMTVDGVPVPTGGSKSVLSNTPNVITETLLSGYSFTSMTGTGTQGDVCPSTLGGSVTLKPGEDITCTITETHP